MSKLEVVVDNTRRTKMAELPLMIECFRCRHQWSIDLNDIVGEVNCPVCDGDVK